MTIPRSLTAGDSWAWSTTYSDYSSTLWTATAYFQNAAESFDVDSSSDGDDHAFAATALVSADRKAGSYHVRVRVTDIATGLESYVAEEGWCDVTPDPASAVKYDPRSWARQTLDAIEAFLVGNATTAQQSISVAGRSISRWSIAELMEWRDRLRQEVRTEEQGSQTGQGRDIKVRYGQP